MDNKTLTIIINKQQQICCLNKSTNITFCGYLYYFQTPDRITYHCSEIYTNPTLISFSDYSFIRFIIHDGTNFITSLTEDISGRLLNFFMKGQDVILCDKHDETCDECSRNSHDCRGFVYYFYDEPCIKPHYIKLTTTDNIKAGNIVFMAKTMRVPYTNVHYAIYLGNGVYISKFGVSGPIIFNDLAELMIGFGSEVYGVLEMAE
ncbi:NlpC/P60 family [Orpheovirus IHUMI-LCC2]|uniref:NlpC/P60 family n=1 Tax=Orpheovirus IHUMI-LCC2 TaxID=2023057 RepID=A0A2I2L418_9VIRU|nr:NlpC/P60 family [Orpheovirus IHUMI-LCC2]SNW62273.1 NlpC/P60 family [Orpheovirus IHUMI-LCC2]